MNEKKFDISINPVKKIPVPLLVIGLGGTGKDAVIEIKKTFAERYVLPKNEKGQDLPAPEKTAYLVFDSVASRPEELESGEYVDISLAGLDKILKNQKELLTPFERTWVNPRLETVSSGIGMGTIRQAARLALSRNFEKVRDAIDGALHNITSVTAGSADPRVKNIEIAIVTGIGGGTGSGIFLDLCQIIRTVANPILPARLTGYLVMPDVSLARITTAAGMSAPIKHNAYAAMKELDFWMRVKEHQVRYTMEYGNGTRIEWRNPPFDQCILMSSSNVEGIPYKDGYNAVMSTIAENLMHYMAEEVAVKAKYSYREYEDNLNAVGESLPQKYPLFHGYRAIGAFTKRIPKKSILYYEGSLLLKSFVPLRDDSGKLQPDRRMFTDGQGKPRAEGITGNGPQLMQDFRTSICKLPGFCNLDLSDKVKVASVQNMNPPPHNKWHTWRDTVSSPAAIKAAEGYLEKAWSRFENWATTVIMDPEQGPFALMTYLDAQDGILANLQETLNSWTAQYNKTRNTLIAQGEEMCANSWGSFRNPPLLGRTGALEQYDHAIKSLYTYVNNCQFLEKHTAALEKLILRVKEYLKDGLKPLCASIEFLEKEFNTADSSDNALVQDIYNLSTVQENINEAFTDANANNKLSSEFLRKIAEISFRTMPNVDAKTSGVAFTCRQIGLDEMCKVLQADMEETYGRVNNQSLDDIMRANVGEGVPEQEKWMDNLARSAINSALPMFLQDPVFKDTAKAAYSYMSIPQNAKKHVEYIGKAFSTQDPKVEPKESTLDDHIYVLMAWDRLGMFRYGMFEDLRTTYDNDLAQKGCDGVHLVRNGREDEDYQSDWSLLPSPKPYFLFPGTGVYSEQEQYRKVHDLVERGIACGMIKVKEDVKYAEAELNILYSGEAVTATSTLQQQAQMIVEAINPATGAPYAESEIAEKLAQLLEGGRKITLKETKVEPKNIASVLGLEHEPIDPSNSDVRANVIQLEIAKKNYNRLCVAMTEVMIYTRPDLVRALQLQLPGQEAVRGRIRAITEGTKVWETRQAYTETAANMFLFLNDVIFQGGRDYKYKDKGNKYDIINSAIMAEDVRNFDSALMRAVCFLSDAPADNPAKADLTRMLTAAMRDYEDGVDNETITREELDELSTAAGDVVAELGDDRISLERELHTNPGKKDQLQPQIELMDEMTRMLEGWRRSFRKIAKRLD